MLAEVKDVALDDALAGTWSVLLQEQSARCGSGRVAGVTAPLAEVKDAALDDA